MNRNIFLPKLVAISLVVFLNACLFLFMWQTSVFESASLDVERNERILASLEDENRTLVADAISRNSNPDNQVASVIYKNGDIK